jgi:asparagine synthase (glutamine-hydrolysing)
MCGIAGQVYTESPLLIPENLLSHRGPDAYGKVLIEGPSLSKVELHHWSLQITSSAISGNQPATSPCGRYVFVYNGEIYNHAQLASTFSISTELSDTDVLAYGLSVRGLKFLEACDGMWAIAIYDTLSNVLHLCRDRFGVKPLYYCQQNGTLSFSSELGSFAKMGVSAVLTDDWGYFCEYQFGYESSQETIYPNIKRVLAGSIITISKGEISSEKWWSFLDSIPSVNTTSYAQQCDHFRDLLADAVHKRRPKIEYSVSCSGGLDSTTLAAIISSNSEDLPIYYSCIFNNSDFDERLNLQRLIEEKQLQVKFINAETNISVEEFIAYTRHMTDPYCTIPNPIIDTYKTLSTEYSVRITLEGHGADELLCGYYGGLTSSLGLFEDSALIKEYLNIEESMLSGCYSPNEKLRLRDRYTHLIRSSSTLFKTVSGRTINKKGFASRPLYFDQLKIDQSHDRYREMDSLTRVLYELYSYSVLPTLLRNYDLYSMLSSVECRSPFLDHHLSSFIFSLPMYSKVGGTYAKRILRDSFHDIVPDYIRLNRRKVGWNYPIHEWLSPEFICELGDTLGINHVTEYKGLRKYIDRPLSQKTYLNTMRVWTRAYPFIWKAIVSSL